jgi:hypothetical protein
MTGRDGTKGNNRRRMTIVGGAVGAFAAAAAMATGSTVTAAPAKADIDALLDPIIQPIVTSLSDAIAGFDPAGAADLTSWTDSLLASLNSLDAALPASAEPAAASASSSYDIPVTMQEITEPTVQASIDGTSNTLLVDTGSSGLVIPWEALGSNDLSALENLFTLGLPSSFGESGYSGGVQYIYLTYDNIPVNYGDGLETTSAPTEVEIFSWPSGSSGPDSFEQFLADDDSTGILGIGDAANAGPGESPFESAGYSGVTVDLPQSELVVGANAGTPIAGANDFTGAPTPTTATFTETVTDGSTVIGTGPVSDDVDSGGVFGTIPSTIDGTAVAPGDTVSVYDGSTLLYSYQVTTIDSYNDTSAPEITAGTAGSTNAIDSGVEPYLEEPIYINYTDDTLTFDKP